MKIISKKIEKNSKANWIDQNLRKIKRIVRQYISEEEASVFLFGSRMTGQTHQKSDYDIGIQWTSRIRPGLLYQIEQEFLRLPIHIDLIDFSLASEKFKEYVFQEGVRVL